MSKIIIGAIVGAVIGYITNYIAIKMLFKPHTEKKLFGFKVPFTPGLIPKEKDRIAKSVGENIGQHLLNGNTIKKALKEEKIKKYIDEEIVNQTSKILNSKKTIKETYSEVLNLDFNKLNTWLSEKILDIIWSELSKNSFKENTYKYLEKSILNNLKKKPKYLINFLDKKIVRDKIGTILNEFLDKEKLKLNQSLLNKLDCLENNNEKIKKVIPNELQSLIQKFIYDEKDIICENIYGLFLREEVSREIKDTITNNILGKLNPLVSMFLNVDVLYDKFLESAKVYFEEEKNQEIIASVINQELKEFSNKEVCIILNKISNETKKELISKASNKIVITLKQNLNAEMILGLLKEKVNNYNNYVEILEDLSINYKELLKCFVDKIHEEIKESEEVKNNIKEWILKFIENIGEENLSKFISCDKEIAINSICLVIQNKYDYFIENKIEKMLGILNIPNIVEKEIKNFEIDYAEKIILDIANKELKAITWLGGLLGGILGIVTPILSKLY